MNISIGEIKVEFLPIPNDDNILAYCSVVLDNAIRLNSIAVRRERNGKLKLYFPSHKKSCGQFWFFYPINKGASSQILQAIENKLNLGVNDNEKNKTQY